MQRLAQVKKHIYTVSELTRKARMLLQEHFPAVWVEGEISNFTHHSSGHMYYSIKDKNSVLSCALYRNVNQGLKFRPADGMQVICFGKITVYEKGGRYQLVVYKIEPKGAGLMQQAFERLKARLAQEGLFEQKHKQPIPFFPQRVGVVTSPTGAAIRDIEQVLNRRFANLEVILNPVTVQGDGAAQEIARAIDEFNEFGRVDVLIVGRGGGSLEDLWPFNEEVVARAIFRSRIPVVSAVGHEIDYTISDFVADLRAPTPSAAAEQVIIHKQELLNRIDSLYSRISTQIDHKIKRLTEKFSGLSARYAFRQPGDLIQQYQQRIDDLAASLELKMRHLVDICRERYNVLIGKLKALSPLNILSRGYSITLGLPEENIITQAQAVTKGSRVKTKLARGWFISRVEQIQGAKDARD